MYLKPGCEAEYEKRHAAIWPELKALLSQNGVSDYSIYWDKETNILFAFQKTEGGAGSQDLGNTEIVQKWWDYMADIMEVQAESDMISNYIEMYHLAPAKYMNQKHWLAVPMDGTVRDSKVLDMLDMGYDIVDEQEK